MKNIKPLKTTVEALKNSDFSGLKEFESVKSNEINLFLNGRFFNSSLKDFATAYQKEGINSIKKIDGDFTLFIVEANKISIVRDRHGVGCQVFYSDKFLTSNLLDFTTLSDFECKPNVEALFTFLSIGFIPSPMSSLEGVKKLTAGNILIIENGKQTVTDLYPASDFLAKTNTCKLSLDEATEEYEHLHKQAIKQRIEG